MDSARKGRRGNQEFRRLAYWKAYMSEVESIKKIIVQNMSKLRVHCNNGNHQHNCPLKQISEQIKRIHGKRVIVNDEFRGIIFQQWNMHTDIDEPVEVSAVF